MYIVELLKRMLAYSNNFRNEWKTFIKVKYSNLHASFSQLYFILFLNSRIINKNWIALLNFNEADMLMNSSFDNRVSFMVFFHQHKKTWIRNSKHVWKLFRVDSWLLGCKHSRFFFHNFCNFFFFTFILYSKLWNLSLSNFIFNISFWIILPFIVNLLVDNFVGFLKILSDLLIHLKFNIHLHFNEFTNQLCLQNKRFDLSFIWVFKVIALEIYTRSLCH